jgi:transposase
MWVPPEVLDPICRHAPTRKSISFFGAVRLRDGKLCMSRPEGMFDAQTCWAFLRKLERIARRSGRQVVVIIDNARYHHAALHAPWRQQVEDHFRLHFLPPYSPDLNPIELAFAELKARLRSAAARSVEALWHALGQLLDAFTPTECANYLAHAGSVPSNREML